MTAQLVIDEILKPLNEKGYDAYIVGGAVRDMALGHDFADIDVATSARPNEIIDMFPGATYVTAQFSAVVLVPINAGKSIEVATFRKESRYLAGIPQTIEYVDDLATDLTRRDARFNAMAMDANWNVIDPLDGLADLQDEVVSTPKNPYGVIEEHPIRMMRYLRFASCLGFVLGHDLRKAVYDLAHLIIQERWEAISKELMKGLGCRAPHQFIRLLYQVRILDHILPEVMKMHGQKQNIYHGHAEVYAHAVSTMQSYSEGPYASDGVDPLKALTALLHDVGKPPTAVWKSNHYCNTFYRHEIVGAEIAKTICQRLRLSTKDTKKVVLAIRHHMYEVRSSRAAKRFVAKFDGGNDSHDTIRDRVMFALAVRQADASSATKITDIRRLENEDYRVIDVLDTKSPFAIRDLAINGHDVMEVLEIKSGKSVGSELSRLLSLVIDDTVENERTELIDECKRHKATLASGT